MLLEIRVRDNDVTAPRASVSLWSGKGMAVTTNDAASVPASTPTKQLTLEEGSGLPVWTATDEELVGRPLAFHFNVYDSSMTGIRTGTVATASVTFGPAEAGTIQNFALTLNDDMNLEATVVSPAEGVSMPGAIPVDPGF